VAPMRRQTVVTSVAVWAVTVGGVAAVTWGVIDVAGGRVLDDSAVPTVERTPSSAPTDAAPTDGSRWKPGHRRATAVPSSTPGGSSPTEATTTLPSPSAGASSSPAPSAGTDGPRHQPGQFTGAPVHPTPTEAPAPPIDSATWTGAAGTVTVSCRTGEARLQGATPADGYRVEVEQEDDAVEVQFQREHPEDEVHVRATCVNGQPRFDVDDHRTGQEEPESRD
jgi:hypothetical protein